MKKAGDDEGASGGRSPSPQQLGGKAAGGKVQSRLSAATSSSGPGWTKVSCPCCYSDRVEPLVLVKLGQKVGPETKRWLMKLIGAPHKDGGEDSGVLLRCRSSIETFPGTYRSAFTSKMSTDQVYSRDNAKRDG